MNIPGGGGAGGSSWASATVLSSSFLGAGNTGNGSVAISHTASQVVISESVSTSLPYGTTRVLTATIEDSAGTVVDTGPDSTPSITFAKASGTATVSGLGSVTAVAGIATITVTGTGVGTLGVTAASAAFTSSSLSITVVAASQSIGFSQPATPATYGTAFTVTPTATSGLGVTVQASGGCTDVASGSGWSVTMTSGTTDCTLTATQAGNTSYNAAADVVRTVSAAKATQSVLTLTGVSSGTYGDTYTLTAAGGSGTGALVFSESGAACQIDSSTSSSVSIEIVHGTGSCTVTATKASDANYGVGSIGHAVAAQLRPLGVNAIATSKTYGDPDPTFGWTLAGFASTDTASNSGITGAPSCSRTGGENVATDQVTCAPGTLAAPNYSFATGGSASFAITPAPLGVTASDASAVYGNAVPTITPNYLGLKNGDGAPSTPPTCGTTATPASDVGEYPSTCHDAADSNYSITYTAGTVTITKADQTVTFAQPASPAVFGDVFALSPTASSGLAVDVTASGGCSVTADGANWNVTMTSGTVDCTLNAAQAGDGNFTAADSVEHTVGASKATQDALSTTAPASATYGDSAAVDASGGSGSGTWAFALGASSSCSLSSTTATEAQVLMTAGVGSCEVDLTHAADSNYLAASTSVSIAAVKRTLTVDATDGNKTYGGDDPQLGYVLDGFINGEDDSVVGGSATCSRAAGEGVGSYAITCVPATLSATDYSFATGIIGQLVIGQADLTITASDVSIHFGEATPVIAPIYAGLAGGDSAPSGAPTCATVVTSASSPGVYASTCQGASDANYRISYVAGIVTVLKAVQTLTFAAPAAAATFGTSFTVDPTTTSPLPITLVATGGCSADATVTGWTITMTSGTNNCSLTASQGGDANFEPATDVTRTISAQRAEESALTVTAPTSGVYGTSIAVTAGGGSGTGGLSYSASGSCVSIAAGDSVQLTAGAGFCTVTVTRAADADYRAATATASITALPAVLKVDAVAASKSEGDADPTFGWTLTGFIGNDVASAVSGTADCTRPGGETAGSYAISCAPGSLHASNYSFAIGASAALTITPAPTPTATPTPTPTDSAGGTGTSGSGSKSTTSGGGKPGAFSLTAFVLPAGIVLLALLLAGGTTLFVRRRRGV
ncbi:MAG: hypothetical protein JWQ39_1444 [Glaciihabitans sp.]|nr:hypothetical protein [Glaciihabitans sp.]